MDSYFFILTTIDLFVLGFMSLLTKLSESLNKKQKRGFLLAFTLIACISVLEVITIVVDGAPPGYRWLNILSNYLGFGLTPAVALCLVYVLDKKSIIRRGFKAAVCCEGAYLLFLAATLPYGLVFSVSRENLYARGEYFYIYVAMYYAAMLYLMVATVRTAAAFQNRSRTLIFPLTLFLGAETVIQIALPSLHVTWLCVTLLSVLYYIYCSEMWNQLDALTGVLNQITYLNGTADAFALVKRLDNPGLSVNLDLSTVLAQGEHLQSFIDDMQYVSHVHISEPGLVPIERRPEHKELALLLGAVGYRGFVSVEMAHTDVDTIRRTMDYIAEVFA